MIGEIVWVEKVPRLYATKYIFSYYFEPCYKYALINIIQFEHD